MLGRGLEEPLDVAAAGEMLADRAQHDDAYPLIFIERLEHQAQLIALRHLDHVERRTMQHDIGALLLAVEFDLEAVERRETRIAEGHGSYRGHARVPVDAGDGVSVSASNSPATSLRRSNLPTGDFGISVTNT